MHDMKAPRLAEAYCDRLYERRARGLTRAPSAGLGPRSLVPAWSARDMQPGQDIYLALVEVRLCLCRVVACCLQGGVCWPGFAHAPGRRQ